jgi:hypothetical protein
MARSMRKDSAYNLLPSGYDHILLSRSFIGMNGFRRSRHNVYSLREVRMRGENARGVRDNTMLRSDGVNRARRSMLWLPPSSSRTIWIKNCSTLNQAKNEPVSRLLFERV